MYQPKKKMLNHLEWGRQSPQTSSGFTEGNKGSAHSAIVPKQGSLQTNISICQTLLNKFFQLLEHCIFLYFIC